MTRAFPVSVQRAALDRAGGVCQCGCGLPFSDHPKERPEFDHIVPVRLGGRSDLDNCLVRRVDHHQAKTATEDMPKIAKVRRGEKARQGIKAPKRPIGDPRFRKKVNGEVVRKDG